MEPYREARPSGMRASDQERDATVQRLQVAFAEGRLADEEFDERMRTALAARTHGDLWPGNLLWGAPHIHGELLELGIEIAQSTVGK